MLIRLDGTISCEGLAYQRLSKVAQRTITMFQSIIEWRDNQIITDSTVGDVVSYGGMMMRQQLPKILLEELNLRLERLNFSGEMNGIFLCSVSLGRSAETLLSYYRANGNPMFFKVAERIKELAKANGEDNRVTLQEFERIAKTVNQSRGSWTGTLAKQEIGIKLYIDPYTAFTRSLQLGETAADLTAEELTAILLHEIGHAYVYTENAVHQFLHADLLRTATAEALPTMQIDDVATLMAQAAPTELANITKTASAVQTAIDKMETKPSVATSLAAIVALPMVAILGSAFGALRLLLLQSGRAGQQMPKLIKTSDLPEYITMFHVNERRADEYVAGHGLGPALASVLTKLNTTAPFDFLAKRESGLLWHVYNALGVFVELIGYRPDAYTAYDAVTTRITKIRQHLVRHMAISDLPTEQWQLLLGQIDQIDKELAALPNYRRLSAAMQAVLEFLGRHASIGALVNIVRDAKLTTELTTLIERIEVLRANELLVSAARLDRMLK